MKQRYRTLADYFEQTDSTQADLARAMGVSKACISLLARGEGFASAKLAARIAEHTGVPVASMVNPSLAALLTRAS